jgi:hypothetical protein
VLTKLGDQFLHEAYLLGKDTTLIAKITKRMLGTQKWKDQSDNADREPIRQGTTSART